MYVKICLLSIALLCLGACERQSASDDPSETTEGKAASAQVKLYVFDCGYFHFDDVTSFGLTNDETDVRDLFVPCYLIDHPAGRLLWDAGLPMDMAGRGELEYGPGIQVRYDRALIDQLADMDITADDVQKVAFSHMHFDHVGSANLFVNSTMLIQQSEYTAAFEHADENPVFDATLYDKLADTPKVLLTGDFDVFGDGSVQIFSTPGHTPGHQTLLINLNQFGPVLLSGDLYHFEKSRELRRTPTFNTDAEQTLASMDRMEQLLIDRGATLWIEHNQALANTLRLAPAFYD